MRIQKYNSNFVYDNERGLYLARTPLRGERAIDAAKRAGIEVKFTGIDNRYLTPPTNPKDLEKLMQNLEPVFPNTKSRTPTVQEYSELIKWAEGNDSELLGLANRNFEVLYNQEKGIYIVNFGIPQQELTSLEEYSPDFPIGLTVREVIEKE